MSAMSGLTVFCAATLSQLRSRDWCGSLSHLLGSPRPYVTASRPRRHGTYQDVTGKLHGRINPPRVTYSRIWNMVETGIWMAYGIWNMCYGEEGDFQPERSIQNHDILLCAIYNIFGKLSITTGIFILAGVMTASNPPGWRPGPMNSNHGIEMISTRRTYMTLWIKYSVFPWLLSLSTVEHFEGKFKARNR